MKLDDSLLALLVPEGDISPEIYISGRHISENISPERGIPEGIFPEISPETYISEISPETYISEDIFPKGLRVRISGIPQSQGHHRVVPTGWRRNKAGQKVRAHKITESNKALYPWRDRVINELVRVWGDSPALDGEVYLCLWFTFGDRPKAHTYKDGTLKEGKPLLKNTDPDIDTLTRAILDALEQAGVVVKDARICALMAVKGWGQKPGVVIALRERSNTRIGQTPEDPSTRILDMEDVARSEAQVVEAHAAVPESTRKSNGQKA